jgi:PAS domain S-box-containing protein
MPNAENKQSLSFESIITIVAVFIVLIPLAILTLISLYNSSNALTNVIKNELEAQSILVGFSINSFIDERIIDARIISQADVLEMQDINQKIQYLTEIVNENKWIDDIDIISPDGTIIASSGVQNEKGDIFWRVHSEYKALYLAAIKATQGQVFVSEATILDDGPGILFLTPITDDSNTKLINLLAVEVNLKNISKILTIFNQGIESERYAYVVDNSGKIIASNNPFIEFLDVFPDLRVQPKLLNAFSLQGDTGNIIYTDTRGVAVLAAYSDMAEFGENNALDWSVIAIDPLAEITVPVTNLKYILIILSAIISIMSALVAYRVTAVYSKNLEKVATRAKNISKGIYSNQPQITSKRKGAFNTLVNAFNQMETNLKELISELKDREQRLDITLNSIGDGVIATDPKGHVTRMNPTAEKMTGWNFVDAEGKPIVSIFSIIDETSREPVQNPIEKVIATGSTVYLSNHTTLLSKDGSEHQIEDSAAPICDEDNKIHGMILIFSDVTRRKQAEKQYRRSLKMDALGKLTGGIAHDYNNILGIIIGYCDLLIKKINDQPESLSYVNTIQQSAERGASLTRKLLDFSRHKNSEKVKLNFNTLLQNQELMIQKTLTVRIDLILNLEKELWPVYLDESDVIDAILNISINAMHAIEGNGRLTIRTTNIKINELDADNLDIVAGDYVLLSITDTGCGMDEKTRDRIFDPFFSTKGENGTGLGLSQVYGFVQRSNGVIKIYSEKQHGSQFALYFPRHHEISQEQKPLNDESLVEENFVKATHTETILVVDDEADLTKFCCQVLKQSGFNTLFSLRAKDALEILENEKVDILLSDIIMPEMSGYELASIVRKKYPAIKIQLASGFSDERIVNEDDKVFQQSILHKPYSSQELLQAISRLIK